MTSSVSSLQHQFTNITNWFWDPAATYQINHRLVYIGLHNKYGRYQWTDGSELRYILYIVLFQPASYMPVKRYYIS